MSFVSVLKKIGHDFKIGLERIFPYLVTTGQVAVDAFFPGVSAIYKSTVTAVALAEQKYVALGQEKAGAKKLADVLNLMEPVVAKALEDAGLEHSTQAVINYINSVVTILNTAPALQPVAPIVTVVGK